MTNIRRINYSNDKQITAIIADNTDNFLWIAFAQNSSGNCIIEKQSGFEPNQTFFSLTRAVDNIPEVDLDSNNLYVAYDDSSLIGEIIDKDNPLTTTTEISIPVGISESPVDVKVNGTDLYFLTPGEISGENAKIVKYNTSGTFQEIIDLSKSGTIINNATSFTIDSNGDLWIITYEAPSRLVRVFALSGGGYNFTSYNIL